MMPIFGHLGSEWLSWIAVFDLAMMLILSVQIVSGCHASVHFKPADEVCFGSLDCE